MSFIQREARLLLGRLTAQSPARTATAWAVVCWPDRGQCVGNIEEHGMHFLDQAPLHGEELGNDPAVGRDGVWAPRTVFQPEAHHRQHDAAFFVHHWIAPIPQIAADETSLIEAARS